MSEEKNGGVGHNSQKADKAIENFIRGMARIDAKRKALNDEASELRQALVDNGVEKESAQDRYRFHKKRRHNKEAYNEDCKRVDDVAEKIDMIDLFSFLDKDAPEATKAAA